MENKRKAARFAVMIRVEVMWEDETRTPCAAVATIEDQSDGGVGIRTSTPITIGSKLTIKTHREQFSGVVTNSRADDQGYVIGIKLDTAVNADSESPTSS
jgi:hypothetical protein